MLGHLGLHRPDVVLQPLHQRQVVSIAAEEGHRRMGMRVDEARDGSLVTTAEDLGTLGRIDVWGDTLDVLALDEDIGDLVLQEHLLDE